MKDSELAFCDQAKAHREALTTEYKAVVDNFRLLTEIRFKLLGLVPIASAVAAAYKPEMGPNKDGLVFALLGLAATLGVTTYHARNNQLYSALIARAAAIERQLGVPDGTFATRPGSPYSLHWGRLTWPVEHQPPIVAVYVASIALWIFLTLQALHLPPVVAGIAAMALAIGGFMTVARVLKAQNETARAAATAAHTLLVEAERAFLDSEAPLKGAISPGTGQAVVSGAFLNGVDADRLAALCAEMRTGRKDSERTIGEVKRKIGYYSKRDAVEMQFFTLPASPDRRAAQMLSLLADRTPEWIYDVATGRDGKGAPCAEPSVVAHMAESASRTAKGLAPAGSALK